MKVLLKEDVDTLGYSGEVHDVAPGYGRNYLIPQGFAVKATPGVLRAAESWRRKAEARREQVRQEHEAMVERLSGTVLTFTAKAGEQGKLYGSITTQNMADALSEELGIEIDRRKIDSTGLRQVGEHQVPIVLSRDYRAQIVVNIHPELEAEETTVEVEENAADAAASTEGEAAASTEGESAASLEGEAVASTEGESAASTGEEAVTEESTSETDFDDEWEEQEYLEDIAEEITPAG